MSENGHNGNGTNGNGKRKEEGRDPATGRFLKGNGIGYPPGVSGNLGGQGHGALLSAAILRALKKPPRGKRKVDGRIMADVIAENVVALGARRDFRAVPAINSIHDQTEGRLVRVKDETPMSDVPLEDLLKRRSGLLAALGNGKRGG